MAVVMMRVVVMRVMVKGSVRSPSLILSDLVMHACDKNKFSGHVSNQLPY